MGYPNRRYSVVDGKLAKRWDGTNDPGWFMTKVEARAAEEARLKKAANVPFGGWTPGLPPAASTPAPESEPVEYEDWTVKNLRSEIKARTGKGPKVGAESTKVAMIERLRRLLESDMGWTGAPVPVDAEEPKPDGKPVVAPPAE